MDKLWETNLFLLDLNRQKDKNDRILGRKSCYFPDLGLQIEGLGSLWDAWDPPVGPGG